MATSAAAAMAAKASRARREIRESLEAKDAFSPARAAELDLPTRFHRRQLDVLIGSGIVKPTSDGRYWFDADAYRADQERKTEAAKRMMIVLVIAVVLAVSIGAITGHLH